MTDTEISLAAGKSESYMRVLKSMNKEKYNLLKEYGIEEFEHMYKTLKNKLAEIYWEIKETKNLSFANLYRSSNKIQNNYKSIESLNVGMSKFAFSSSMRTTVSGFTKMNIIIKEYEKYKLEKKEEYKYENKNNSKNI